MNLVFIMPFLLFLFPTEEHCSCIWFDSEQAKQSLYDRSDFVIKGRPIKNAHPNFKHHNKNFVGKDILFEVDSVYKGNLNSDVIFIIQSRSNCSKMFSNKEYWIYGDKVDHINLVAEKDYDTSEEGYDSETRRFYLWDKKHVYNRYKAFPP